MPAQSEKQAIAARIARGIQKGEVKPKAGTASAEMAKMPAKSLKHFTKTESMNTTTNSKFDAMINALATRAKVWKDSEGQYEPEDITYGEFLNFVVDDPKTGPAIKKLWYSLDRAKQDQIFNKVIDVLYSMSENVNLSKMAKKMMETNKPAPLMLNGKEVDDGSIKLSTQDGQPYITAAKYIDGTNISTPDLEKLEQAIESQYEGGLRRFAGFDF